MSHWDAFHGYLAGFCDPETLVELAAIQGALCSDF